MIDWLNSELVINLAIDQSTHESCSSTLNSYITFCWLHGFNIEPTQHTSPITSPSNPCISTQNLLTAIYLASATNLSHISLTCRMSINPQWNPELWKGQNATLARPPIINSLWLLIILTPYTMPSELIPHTMMHYLLPSSSLGLRIHFIWVSSAGPTKLPCEIIIRWPCGIWLRFLMIILVFSLTQLCAFFLKSIGGQLMHAGGATALAEAGVALALIQAAGRWSSDTFSCYIWKNVFSLWGPTYWSSIFTMNRPFPCQCSLGHSQNPYIPIDFISTLELQDTTQLLPSSPLPSSHGLLAVHVLFLMSKSFKSDPEPTLGSLLSLLKHWTHVLCTCKPHGKVN